MAIAGASSMYPRGWGFSRCAVRMKLTSGWSQLFAPSLNPASIRTSPNLFRETYCFKIHSRLRNGIVLEIGGRYGNVLSFEEFVLQSIVLELLELLEGLQRSGTHVSMISPDRLRAAR